MPSWKKVVASGSNASFSSVSVDTFVSASSFKGSFTGSLQGTASQAISSSYALTASSAISSSYVLNAISASQAATASSANTFNVRTSLTASGLRYPTADGAYASQVLQTDASGNLSFGDVSTTFDNVYNGEATTLVKGTPVYISGSNGANPKVFIADAADANKMPVTYIVSENISAGNVGRGITLGHIEGIDLTGYAPGTSVYVNSGGGWTSTRPTGSNVTIQFLGLVTKEGSGGKGLVLNPGPATLPNIQTGYTWVGNGNSYPVAVTTSSLLVTSASYAQTSSFANNFTVANTLTAQTLVVSTISSSITYSSGSNIFGNSTTNTQTFTGSVNITGSLNLNGKATLTDLTGSLFGTASWAQNASTASYVVTAQTASYVANAVSSSYAYTASSAINASASLTSISASYALTASFALNGGGGGLSALYIADEGITQGTASYLDFTGPGVIATVSNNTASITISGGGSAGQTTTLTQSIAATTWSLNHNLNTNTPIVQIYDTTYNQIIPQYVSASNATTVIVGFGIATAGYAVVSTGGTLTVTGSNVILNQPTPATTWSFVHNLNNQYPVFQVFDANNEVVIPQRIVATDYTSSLIYFPSAVSGKAVASVGGYSGSVTASFAVNSSTASYALAVPFTGILSNPISASTGTAAASSTTVVASASTSSYYAAFFDYAATSGSNSRAGTVMSVWNGASVQYNEVTTNDIGNTQQVTMSVALSGGTVQLKATTTNAWTIRSLSRLI